MLLSNGIYGYSRTKIPLSQFQWDQCHWFLIQPATQASSHLAARLYSSTVLSASVCANQDMFKLFRNLITTTNIDHSRQSRTDDTIPLAFHSKIYNGEMICVHTWKEMDVIRWIAASLIYRPLSRTSVFSVRYSRALVSTSFFRTISFTPAIRHLLARMYISVWPVISC